jgi:hypothetical protein
MINITAKLKEPESTGVVGCSGKKEDGMTGKTLKGMTWDHPRGYELLVAASRAWQRLTGTAIEWERRSLQDFETYPVEDLPAP